MSQAEPWGGGGGGGRSVGRRVGVRPRHTAAEVTRRQEPVPRHDGAERRLHDPAQRVLGGTCARVAGVGFHPQENVITRHVQSRQRVAAVWVLQEDLAVTVIMND